MVEPVTKAKQPGSSPESEFGSFANGSFKVLTGPSSKDDLRKSLKSLGAPETAALQVRGWEPPVEEGWSGLSKTANKYIEKQIELLLIKTPVDRSEFIKSFEGASRADFSSSTERLLRLFGVPRELPDALSQIARREDPSLSRAEAEAIFETYAGKIKFPASPTSVSGNESAFVMVSPSSNDFNMSGDFTHRWLTLHRAITDAGGVVLPTNGHDPSGGRTETYTRDSVLIIGDTVLVPKNTKTRPEHSEDRKQLLPILKSLGYRDIRQVNAAFDGGDIIHDPERKILFMGVQQYPSEADRLNIKELSTATGLPVIAIPRETVSRELPIFYDSFQHGSDSFYHLDLFIARLPNGKYLFTPGVTTRQAEAEFFERIGNENIIKIPLEDAKRMTTNMVAVRNGEGNTTLITPSCSGELRKQLEAMGYQIEIAPMLFDAGPHCMSLDVKKVRN